MPLRHIAAEQAIFGQQELVAAFPSAEFEQLAVMPKVAQRLPQHIGQKLHCDEVEQFDAPFFAAAQGFVDVKGGAAVLGFFCAVPEPHGFEALFRTVKDFGVAQHPLGKDGCEMLHPRACECSCSHS